MAAKAEIGNNDQCVEDEAREHLPTTDSIMPSRGHVDGKADTIM